MNEKNSDQSSDFSSVSENLEKNDVCVFAKRSEIESNSSDSSIDSLEEELIIKKGGRPIKYDNDEDRKKAIRESKRKYAQRPTIKDRIKNSNKKKIKIKCVCGGRYTTNNKSNHLNTKIHKSYINQEE